jgi:signal transduction histidine kinase
MRARMTLAFTLYIAFLIALLSLSFFYYLEHQEWKSADATLAAASLKLSAKLEAEEPGAQSLIELVKAENDELRAKNVTIVIADPTGRVIAHSLPETPAWPLSSDWRYRTLPFHGYTVAVAMPWREMREWLSERAHALLIMGTLVVLLSSVGVWILVGRTLSPLDGLTQEVSVASAENLRVQLQSPSSDAEMVRLVSTLNDLLNRLSQTAQLEGRFYAAASHELRTPLHSLNLLHEVALSRPREIGEYRDALVQSHEQVQGLTRLVQDLLLLNQLDMKTSQFEAVLLDLADICEGELNHIGAQVEEKSLQVVATLPVTCELTAPWTHVNMLVHNLVENAAKYALPNGKIEVSVAPDRFQIWNECEIDEDFNMEKYFEPFYRPDAVRNSETGGNGLGLPICHAVCQTNGWGLTLAYENGGFSAIVDFSKESEVPVA